MKKYIILGASSCLGLALIQKLLNDGMNVVGVVRPGKGEYMKSRFPYIDVVECEMKDYKDLNLYIPLGDVMINLAWEGTKKEYRGNNDLQTLNVQHSIDALKSAIVMGCTLYVDAGSQAEYGWQDEYVTEEHVCKPITEYGKAKLLTYQKCKDLSQKANINYLHLRIFSVFGEGKWDTVLAYCFKQIDENKTAELSSCDQLWNFLYSSDAADLITGLTNKMVNGTSLSEIYNIAGPDTKQLKNYIEELYQTISIDSTFHYNTSEKGVSNLSLMPSTSKIIETTGKTEWVPFRDAIKEYYKSYHQYGNK